jgi:hypothetical protein
MISEITLKQSFGINLSKDEIKHKIYEQHNQNNSFDLLCCHAKDTAIDLYSKNTYLPEEDTILHLIEMRKIIN